MPEIHYTTCNFCDSICGLEIEHDGREIIAVRGDRHDEFSRGHICPKGFAQQDLYNDPDRLRKPMRRRGRDWEEVSWEDALDEAGQRLAAVRKKHGPDSIAVYYGTPTAHDYGSLLALIPFVKGFKTRNIYSATSVDSLTRMLVSLWMYGNQAILPVPDLDRMKLLVIIGANPVVSNGSVMTAPDMRKRLLEMRQRGGRIVVIDPRRTETAAVADAHHFIRPGTDALFLLSMLNVMFAEGIADQGRLKPYIKGLETIREIADRFPPERVAGAVCMEAETIKDIVREFSKADSAALYGRMGVSTQEFGSLATWLVDVVNVVTGNLDREGAMMFATPAVDLLGLSRLLRQPGFFNRWQSRVSGLPEFNGEFPAAALAEEIETEGQGQIRALITNAGNPSLSLPNGRRLDRAFAGLEYMVSIDYFINETTRHANLVLPPTTLFESDHYPVLEHAMAIRNTARYAAAVLDKPEGAKHNWEIMLDLLHAFEKNSGPFASIIGSIKHKALRTFSPSTQLNLLLRFGPHKLSIEKLKQHPHGLDLGPLEPSIQTTINTRDKMIELAPEVLTADLPRLEKKLEAFSEPGRGEYLLITRRSVRGLNTWMRNSRRLVKGRNPCTLMMCPADADKEGFETGQVIRLSSSVGEIMVEVEVTDEMMPGVISLPFGWGHDREGSRLGVAAENPGVSMNDIVDESHDAVSGIAVLDGIPVKVGPT